MFEDGDPQPIGSFTAIFEGARPHRCRADPEPRSDAVRPRTARRAGAAPASPLGTPVTALVFDRLTPEATAARRQGRAGRISATRPRRRT